MDDGTPVLDIVVHYFVWSCLAAAALSGMSNSIHFYLGLKSTAVTPEEKRSLIRRTVSHGLKTGFMTFVISVLVAAFTYPLFAHR